jgi:hypothetical protein
MKRLPKKQLKELFETIVAESGGKCGKANPFIYHRGNFKCYVFIKNISPAYYVNYPDNSRVQLPTSNRFKEVINSNLLFFIIGYDKENEVFASWNPSLIKDRLNEKRNVSVYSRFSWQSKVPTGEFMQHHLGNEEKVILFKKELLNEFFEVYPTLFNDLENNINTCKFEVNGKFNYDMKTVRKIIDPLLRDHKVLQAVSVLEDVLKNEPEYQELSFKDYFKIVNEIYAEIYS